MSRFVMSKTPWERCVYPVLKEALEKTNYNQTELAQSLGTSQFTVSAWARGDPAADVMQEHMDRVMAQIIGGKQELRPFPERYHELRKVTYSRR